MELPPYIVGELFAWTMELLGRGIERVATPSKRVQREYRLGLRLSYGGNRRLEDVFLLKGVHAGEWISKLPPDVVMSLQSTWPHLFGRAVIARWLDRNSPGWRRSRVKVSAAFIPTPPAR